MDAADSQCPFDHRACIFAEQGCVERMPEEDLEAHAAECEYRLVPCPHPTCPDAPRQRDLAQHLLNCALDPCPNSECGYIDTQAATLAHRVWCDPQAQRIIALNLRGFEREERMAQAATAHAEELQRLEADHAARLAQAEADHATRERRAAALHAQALQQARSKHYAEVEQVHKSSQILPKLQRHTIDLQRGSIGNVRTCEAAAFADAARLRESLAGVEASLRDLQRSHDDSIKQRAHLEGRQLELENELAGARSTISGQQATIADLEASLASANDERQQHLHARSYVRRPLSALTSQDNAGPDQKPQEKAGTARRSRRWPSRMHTRARLPLPA